MCLCSLIYSAWHAHSQYYIVNCGVSVCAIFFSTLSHRRHDFLEKVTENKMCVPISSTTIFWHDPHSKKTSATYYHKCTKVFMYNACYCWHILIKIKFSRQLYIFMKIPSVEAELFYAVGQTDERTHRHKYRQTSRHTDINTDRRADTQT